MSISFADDGSALASAAPEVSALTYETLDSARQQNIAVHQQHAKQRERQTVRRRRKNTAVRPMGFEDKRLGHGRAFQTRRFKSQSFRPDRTFVSICCRKLPGHFGEA
jgi:hypothetical protein